VALVGFDDSEISSHPLIQLTTVSQNVKEMGYLGAKMMVEKIEGKLKSRQTILLEPHLVIRQSCGYKPFSRESRYQQSSFYGSQEKYRNVGIGGVSGGDQDF
jgi:hypothetical protein